VRVQSGRVPVATGGKLVHIGARFFFDEGEQPAMEELNGRMLACQILITGLIARVANDQRDPLRFLTTFATRSKPW